MPFRDCCLSFRNAFLTGISILLMGLIGMPVESGQKANASISIPPEGDEFVGPFSSWSNLTTDYGAAGDGLADDTAAIQKALDDLGTPGRSPVLFLPSGKYRITKTLILAFKINLSVVGEDPVTTTIVWDGPTGGNMLSINGVAYSRFTRLTFDGKGSAAAAIEQSWDNSRPHFDTGNEYSDNYFVDVEYGIHGGFKGYGFAETSILRSHFLRNTKAGVSLGNFNALDIWVWYSTFDHCMIGVTNATGAGNFHVYNSIFRNSISSDLSMGHTGGFSARGNYSMGSRAFFVGTYTNNPATIHLQSNTIIDPIDPAPIRLANQGPGLITDNVIRSLTNVTGPVIHWANFFGADVTSIGNTFTVTNPITINGRLIRIDDRVVARSTLGPKEPVLPGRPPNSRRQTFEAPPGATAGEMQQLIKAAGAQNGNRPVVHIPYGSYSISQTLILPASDIQLVGDGYETILHWTGTDDGPVLSMNGPSKATLREIQIDGAAKVDGIVLDNADQIGSRVYMQGVQLRSGKQADLFINGLDHTKVQLEDITYAYSPDGVAVKVMGGPLSAAGKTTGGKTIVFSGASSSTKMSYEVSRGAKVLVRDVWYEATAGPGFAKIYDRAVFTVDGLRVASPANQIPAAFEILNLNGRVAILTSHIDDRIIISGNGSNARVLGLGVFTEQRSPKYFLNNSSPASQAVLANSRQVSMLPGNRSVGTPDIDVAQPAFIKSMLDQTRSEHPAVLNALPAGITDVRMFRVWVGNGLNNIILATR